MQHERSTLETGIGPTEAEIEAWATRERQRREQWVRGPTPEQTALWAVREHERRSVQQQQLAAPRGSSGERRWLFRRSLREIQLAGMGALQLALNTSIKDAMEYLVRAGLDWEEQTSPRRRGESAHEPPR